MDEAAFFRLIGPEGRCPRSIPHVCMNDRDTINLRVGGKGRQHIRALADTRNVEGKMLSGLKTAQCLVRCQKYGDRIRCFIDLPGDFVLSLHVPSLSSEMFLIRKLEKDQMMGGWQFAIDGIIC